mgnify:CR=1 FL=1
MRCWPNRFRSVVEDPSGKEVLAGEGLALWNVWHEGSCPATCVDANADAAWEAICFVDEAGMRSDHHVGITWAHDRSRETLQSPEWCFQLEHWYARRRLRRSVSSRSLRECVVRPILVTQMV